MTKKDLNESEYMHILLYLNNHKNAIIIPVNDKNDYIIWVRFKDPGYYYDECTYPHEFVRISLRDPKYIRPIDDDNGTILTKDELEIFITFMKQKYVYGKWIAESGWNFLLEYIENETYIKPDYSKLPDYTKLKTI